MTSNDINMQKFSGFVESLKGTIALFGVNKLSIELQNKYPERCVIFVCFDDEAQKKLHPHLNIMGMDAFYANPTQNAVITDNSMKFAYLEAIYRHMFEKGQNLLEGGMSVRYDYSHYFPKQYDLFYLEIEKGLPVECTIPTDSRIRIIDCLNATEALEGDILELGTGYGGSTYFIASTLRQLNSRKTITTIDRFENTPYLPELSAETVRKKLSEFSNIRILKGQFEQLLKTLEIDKISFCFWDAYATPATLKLVYPKLSRAAILLIDNYTHGCTTNWGKPPADLFFQDKPEKIIRIGDTQGMVVKQ